VQQELLEHLLTFVTKNKQALFKKNIEQRTKHLTIVLEDIYQPQNASAALRSADCFGIQDVHIIENTNKYTINPDVVLGASKWLNLYFYNKQNNNTEECLQTLKNKGYKIVATTPHINDVTIDKLDLNNKTALVFGTELTGISDTAMVMADEFVKIPMYGFTESFNISVSAAICMYETTKRLRNELSKDVWQLNENEKNEILLNWCKKVVKRSDIVEKDFLSRYNNKS
jgi:tRNA (guanosine-2'-O-)-methyltransferase